MEVLQKKRNIIALCVIAYVVSYLCRTNLSVAMDDLLAEMNIGRSQAGLISTLYFWTYAVGQLIAGALCTKFDPKQVVTVGLIMTGFCNLMIGFSDRYLFVLLLWMLNGLALAFFWPPILQISTNWSEPEEYTKVSILLNLPTTVGFLIAWLGLGMLSGWLKWQWMFWIPAVAAFAFCVIWVWKMYSSPQKANLNYTPKVLQAENQKESGTSQKVSLVKCLLTVSMIAYALIVIIQGCTKESINLWAPSVLNDIANGKNAVQISLFTSLIPVFSTIGLLLTGWLVRCFRERQEQAMLVLLCGGAVSGWLMVWLKNSFAGVAVCMGIVLAVVYGVNTILTTLLPLQFARTGQSGALSSVFNFFSYLGAALGGIVSGWISEQWGWSGVYLMWAVFSTVAMLLLLLNGIYKEFSYRRK